MCGKALLFREFVSELSCGYAALWREAQPPGSLKQTPEKAELFRTSSGKAAKIGSLRPALLPVNLPFLRRIDLCDLDTLVKEKDLHIVEDELVRIGI
jgi:hypothetical protein